MCRLPQYPQGVSVRRPARDFADRAGYFFAGQLLPAEFVPQMFTLILRASAIAARANIAASADAASVA